MKLGQVIQYSKFFLFENRSENEGGRLFPDLFMFFRKALYEVKTSFLQLRFNIFR